MVTARRKGQIFHLLQKTQEASLKHFLTGNSSLHSQSSFYRMNFNKYLFFLLFPLIASVLLWLCLCFHFHVLSILLHYEFSFYLLKVRATVHIFRIHGGVCGYRY